MAAAMLAFAPVDALTHDQHLALLRFLCDAALDTERMRGVLQRERRACVRAAHARGASVCSRRRAT